MPRKRKNERSDGRIQLSAVIGRDANGKLLRKYFYGQTRIEAQRKKDEYLSVLNGRPQTDLTVGEWVDEYLRIYPANYNPLYAAQRLVPYKHIKTTLGNLPLSAVREIDLQRFLNGFKGQAQSTISKQIQALKRVFAKARKNKLISDDPAEDLTAPTGTKGTHRALTQAEVLQIVSGWQTAGNSGLWVMLMLFAGLRRGEMMALDWAAVDMQQKTLTVKQVGVLYNNRMIVEQRAKTRAGTRTIPVTAPLFSALAMIPPDRRKGFVCLSAHSQPLTETAIRRGVEHFIKTVGVSFRCHDLRHTFCTMLYDGGVDVQTAAYLMGHSDVSVTMKIYTHLSEERRTRSTAALLGYFDGIKSGE